MRWIARSLAVACLAPSVGCSDDAVPPAGLASILLKEPAGLSVGKVELASGAETLGVLAEPILCEGQREISEHGGWRAYRASRDQT